MLTIALAWVVPCAATWTIVPYLSSLYFGWGAPIVILAVFAVAVLHMIITAKIFGPKLVKEEERAGLIMELPPYHKPKWGALFRSIFAVSKEAALGVLSTLYVGGGSLFSSTLGGEAAAANLGEVLATAITQVQALAFIFAVTFNVPCLMAITSTYQETRSLKWTLRIALYYIAASLVLAFLAYHIGLLIF